jgi:hypothetical protein
MSGPHVEGPPMHLPSRMVSYYRLMLAAHAEDLITHACPICSVARCPDWCFAWAQLAYAGELINHSSVSECA